MNEHEFPIYFRIKLGEDQFKYIKIINEREALGITLNYIEPSKSSLESASFEFVVSDKIGISDFSNIISSAEFEHILALFLNQMEKFK